MNAFYAFHKELIESESKKSSSRYIVLGSFYVSSIAVLYTAVENPSTFADVFWVYIAGYVFGYVGGKWVAATSRPKPPSAGEA